MPSRAFEEMDKTSGDLPRCWGHRVTSQAGRAVRQNEVAAVPPRHNWSFAHLGSPSRGAPFLSALLIASNAPNECSRHARDSAERPDSYLDPRRFDTMP